MNEKWIQALNAEAPQVDPDDLDGWIIEDTESTLVLNKPGWLVCHPSKAGPWSSLVGACREHFGLDKIHLVARLDRETSGLVILARTPARSRRLQMAIERRQVDKTYFAILEGSWRHEEQSVLRVRAPLARDRDSPVYVKQRVVEGGGGQVAESWFFPVIRGDDFTGVLVRLITGRKHQIRAHASHIGNPVVGDKVYGPDPRHFLHFIDHGWDEFLAGHLRHPRQALHAFTMHFRVGELDEMFTAPLSDDLLEWLDRQAGGPPSGGWNGFLQERLLEFPGTEP